MTTKTQTIYLFAVHRAGEEIHFHISTTDMRGTADWTFIEEKEISFDTPDVKEITPDIIETIKEAQAKIRAEAAAMLLLMDEHIGSLMALEHQS